MSQIFEALRKAEALESSSSWRKEVGEMVERRRSGRRSIAARIRVYGHGQGISPFFEENSILNASGTGALLLMRTPVVAGQKLLLINEAAQRVQECRVVRTSCCDSLELEVAVEFPSPQPEFWTRLEEQVEERGIEKRKRPRIEAAENPLYPGYKRSARGDYRLWRPNPHRMASCFMYPSRFPPAKSRPKRSCVMHMMERGWELSLSACRMKRAPVSTICCKSCSADAVFCSNGLYGIAIGAARPSPRLHAWLRKVDQSSRWRRAGCEFDLPAPEF